MERLTLSERDRHWRPDGRPITNVAMDRAIRAAQAARRARLERDGACCSEGSWADGHCRHGGGWCVLVAEARGILYRERKDGKA